MNKTITVKQMIYIVTILFFLLIMTFSFGKVYVDESDEKIRKEFIYSTDVNNSLLKQTILNQDTIKNCLKTLYNDKE